MLQMCLTLPTKLMWTFSCLTCTATTKVTVLYLQYHVFIVLCRADIGFHFNLPCVVSPAVSKSAPEIMLMSAPMERIEALDVLRSQQTSIGWDLEATQQDHLSRNPALTPLYLLLLFTMPIIPVFTCGDRISLQAGQVSWKAGDLVTCLAELARLPSYYCCNPLSVQAACAPPSPSMCVFLTVLAQFTFSLTVVKGCFMFFDCFTLVGAGHVRTAFPQLVW